MRREPVTIHRKKHELNLSEWKHRAPAESDYSELISEPSLIFNEDTDQLELVYLQLDDDTSDIHEALKQLKFGQSERTSGIKTTSRIFGNQPRALPRRDFCTSSALARENPKAHETIARYSDKVAHYYKDYNPELYEAHQKKTAKVRDEWRMEDSVFTSGIVNRNNALLYHYDSGNYTGVWSNMLVFKDRVSGGYLSLPEFDLAFALPNNSLLMFDGQRAMHGVTPIYQHEADAYRFSVVFYSLKTMWSCLPIDEEISRAQTRRVERERRRLQVPALGTEQ